jgi:hypothetical protein
MKVPKHHQAPKDLLWSLADRVQAHSDERRERTGAAAQVDTDLLARARLSGWKPVAERRMPPRRAP